MCVWIEVLPQLFTSMETSCHYQHQYEKIQTSDITTAIVRAAVGF